MRITSARTNIALPSRHALDIRSLIVRADKHTSIYSSLALQPSAPKRVPHTEYRNHVSSIPGVLQLYACATYEDFPGAADDLLPAAALALFPGLLGDEIPADDGDDPCCFPDLRPGLAGDSIDERPGLRPGLAGDSIDDRPGLAEGLLFAGDRPGLADVLG